MWWPQILWIVLPFTVINHDLLIKVTEENMFDFLKGMGVYDEDKRNNVDNEVRVNTTNDSNLNTKSDSVNS